MTERPSVHLDVAAYALGTLSPEERVSFERHLSSCVRCRAELQELRGVVVLGAAVAPAHESPPGLEARTFAAIERAAVEGPSAVEERSAVGAIEPTRGARERRGGASCCRAWRSQGVSPR